MKYFSFDKLPYLYEGLDDGLEPPEDFDSEELKIAG